MALASRDRACYGPRNAKQPGSVEWCWQTLDLLRIRWQRKDFTNQQFDETLQELRQQEVWRVVPPEKPYGSLEAMLQEEIGCTETEAKKQLQAYATGSSPKGGRPKTCNLHVMTQIERAKHNSISKRSQVKLDYLAGHNADLLTAVRAGTLSIDRAYKLATGTPSETPLDACRRYWRKLSPEERATLLQEEVTEEEWLLYGGVR